MITTKIHTETLKAVKKVGKFSREKLNQSQVISRAVSQYMDSLSIFALTKDGYIAVGDIVMDGATQLEVLSVIDNTITFKDNAGNLTNTATKEGAVWHMSIVSEA